MPRTGRAFDFLDEFSHLKSRVRRLELRFHDFFVDPKDANLPSFALDGQGFDTPSTPVIVDGSAMTGSGTMHFDTTSDSTFDMSSNGRARILVPGFYVIGCQLYLDTNVANTNYNYAYLSLKYGHGSSEYGYSIEIPWLASGFNDTSTTWGGEEIIGTRYLYPPMGAGKDWNVALQRLHPISLQSANFPVEIRPEFNTYWDGYVTVEWMAVWGFRISDNLSSWFSD